MKLVRPLLIVLGIAVLCLGVLAGLAFTPPVQHWALQRYLAGRPGGLEIDVRSVAVGPDSISLGQVTIGHGERRVVVDRLEADYSLAALIFHREIRLDRVRARGVAVEAGTMAPQRTVLGAVAAPVAALGALGRVRLPMPLVVGDLDIEARIPLATEGGIPAPALELKLTGGHLAPGREGTVLIKAQFRDAAPGAAITTFDAQGSLTVTQSLQRTFDHAGLTALVDARGPDFPAGHRLKLAAGLNRGGTGEEYHFQVDTVQNGRTEEVFYAHGEASSGQEELAGDWRLTARTAQLAPFLPGGPLPDFTAAGAGTFSFGIASHRLALRGGFKSKASDLAPLRPALRALGAVTLTGEFDLNYASGAGVLNRGDLTLGTDRPLAELHLAGPLEFDLPGRRFRLVAGRAPEIARVKLRGLPVAWVQPFFRGVGIAGGGVEGELIVTADEAPGFKVHTNGPLTLDRLELARGGRPLLAHAALRFDGTLECSAAQVRAQIQSGSLKTPEGDSFTGTLTFAGAPTTGWPATAEGSFQADLAKLLSRWVPVGPVHAKGSAALGFTGGKIEVRRLAVESADDKGRLIGAIETMRAFVFDPAHCRVEPGPGSDEVQLAALRFGTLPLAVLSRQFPGVIFGGWTNPGELGLFAQEAKLQVRGRSPLRVSELSLALPGQPIIERATAEFSPTVEFTGGRFSRATAAGLVLRDSNGVTFALLTGDLSRAEDGGWHSGLTFDLDLPVFSGQPLLARRDSLSAGRASGEIRAVADPAGTQIEARATLNGLVARAGGQVLPVANLNWRSVLRADGHLSLQVPVLIDHGGERSDLAFSAEGMRHSGGLALEAKLISEHLELSDLLALCAAAGAPVETETSGDDLQIRALSPPAADEAPFWAGLQGSLAVEAKSVTQDKDWAMTKLNGQLAFTPAALQLVKMETGFGPSGKLTAQGTLEFSPGLNPYRFAGGFALTEFDAGKYFKSIDPDRAPTCEGMFAVKARLEGQGLTLGDTLDRTRGQFEMTSRQGIFRGLKRAGEKVSIATKTVELGAALGSLIGSEKVKVATEKVVGSAYYLDQLAQNLGELPYDQLSLKVVREESLDLRFEDVVLVSQEVRLLGKGRVAYAPGRPLLRRPLTATFAIAVQGKTGDIFEKLHLLDGTKDELGYAKVREPLTLSGMLSRPDPTPFFANLAAAKVPETPAP